MWSGRLHGWELASELDLPARPTTPSDPVDLTVRIGDPRDDVDGPPPGERIASWSMADGEPFFDVGRTASGYVVRFHRRCDLVADLALRELVCYPAPGVPLDTLATYVAGGGLATLLNLAGHVVLHASTFAVEAPTAGGRLAIGVLGPTGAGKSTFVALACAAGAHLVGDDVLRVDGLAGADGTPRARAGLASVQLRAPVAKGVYAAYETPPPARLAADGRVAVELGETQVDDVPLAALVEPVRVAGLGAPQLVPLAPADALLAVARSPRVSGWRLPSCMRSHFAGARRIAERVPVLRLELPAGTGVDARSAAEAVALVAELVSRRSGAPRDSAGTPGTSG